MEQLLDTRSEPDQKLTSNQEIEIVEGTKLKKMQALQKLKELKESTKLYDWYLNPWIIIPLIIVLLIGVMLILWGVGTFESFTPMQRQYYRKLYHQPFYSKGIYYW